MESQLNPQNQLYQSLGKGQIRLLRIINTKSDATYCQLETVSLETQPDYCALSYEWAKYHDSSVGDPLSSVIVNSQAISITRNLCLALRFLEPGTAYWIDALCINQDDDSERGHQVRMMTRIYQSATQVFAWLGLGNYWNNLGMGLISQFAEDFYSSTSELDDESIQTWTLTWLQKKLSDPKCGDYWNGLCEILGSSYWKRLWIIQELVVTQNYRDVRLKCGSGEVNFFHLGIILEGIDKLTQDTLKHGSIESQKILERVDSLSSLALFIFRDSILWRNQDRDCMQLLELLRRYSSSLCSDSRDRVYALLGVELRESREYLRVDYSITEAEVYLSAAQYIIKSTRRLDILCACRRPQNQLSLSSWVPDWKQRSELRIANRGWNFGDRWYNDGYNAGTMAVAEISFDRQYLSTKAILLGSIKNICLTSDWVVDSEASESPDSTLLNAQKGLYDWLGFAISVFDPLMLDPNFVENERSWVALEGFYETVVEGYYGRERATTWSRKDFISYCKNVLKSRDVIAESPWSKESTINLLLSMYKELPLFEIDLFQQMHLQSVPRYYENSTEDFEAPRKAIGRCHLSSAAVGDIVVIIRGCSLPILLRPVAGRYQIICELYVHNYMDGEAMRYRETEIQLC